MVAVSSAEAAVSARLAKWLNREPRSSAMEVFLSGRLKPAATDFH
jgi:hypothetical protein